MVETVRSPPPSPTPLAALTLVAPPPRVQARQVRSAGPWRVRIDPERKCLHVNFVKTSNVAGEEEYLFAPYSAFTVLSARWRAGTTAEPHEIELLAAVDNMEEPEDLPLAPWS